MTVGLIRDRLWDTTAGVDDDEGVGVLNAVDSVSVCFDSVFDSNDSECATPITVIKVCKAVINNNLKYTCIKIDVIIKQM